MGPYASRKRMKGFVPAAAAAATAATTFDPGVFTSFMAGTGVAAASGLAVSTGNCAPTSGSACRIDLEEDEIPLTSPAHNLLKRKNRHSHHDHLGNLIVNSNDSR